MSTGLSHQRQGQLGVNAVERVVLQAWGSRWQALDAVNDDGVDGLIFIERGGNPTGQVIHVQVKCQTARLKQDGSYALAIEAKKLKKNAARWRKVVGAAILIRVDPETLEATWTDLRNGSSVDTTQIFIPSANTFDAKAKNAIAALCGTIHEDQLLPEIRSQASDFAYLFNESSPLASARREYLELSKSNLRFLDSNAEVRFTREGWRHMKRRKRSRLSKLQSWNLIGVLRVLVPRIREEALLIVRPAEYQVPPLVAATATILFPHRQSAVVRAIFSRRMGSTGRANYSLLTLYEVRRKKNLLGV